MTHWSWSEGSQWGSWFLPEDTTSSHHTLSHHSALQSDNKCGDCSICVLCMAIIPAILLKTCDELVTVSVVSTQSEVLSL